MADPNTPKIPDTPEGLDKLGQMIAELAEKTFIVDTEGVTEDSGLIEWED